MTTGRNERRQSPASVNIRMFTETDTTNGSTQPINIFLDRNNEGKRERKVTVGDMDWFLDKEQVLKPVNGPVYNRHWNVATTSGDDWMAGCNRHQRWNCMDVFLQMFPPVQLVLFGK
jgi:hypothetical protein